MTTSIHRLTAAELGPMDVTVDVQGEGQPLLLLHGGAGTQSVAGFADLLATTTAARVITPTHPGFDGTARPDVLNSVGGLAALYGALLAALDLEDVTVIGNSVGGWVAAEMATLGSPRIARLVLVDAVGMDVPGHPVADFFALTMEEVTALAFHAPDKFRIDPSSLPPAAQAIMAANRAALAAYGGVAMTDPGLAARLAGVKVPTLVLWGESDRLVDPEYGRAFAEAIPGAHFEVLAAAGHLPQMEAPEPLRDAIWRFMQAACDIAPSAS